MNTELRAKTYNKLINLIEVMNDDLYIKKIYNNKVYYIAYVGIEGFRSFMIGSGDKMYLFIKEELTEQERIEELNYVFNGNMDYFDNEEIEKIKKISNDIEKSRKMKFKSINHDDIETVLANAAFKEYSQIRAFSDEIDKYLMSTDRLDWDIYGKLLYMFKLGVMQGKREERARRRSKIVYGQSTN